MALHDITTKILDDAKKQVAQIKRTATREAKRIIQEAEKANKQYEVRSDHETKQELERRERTALSQARRQAQQIVNARKRQLVDEVLRDAGAQIAQADDDAYTAFCEKLLVAVPQDLRAQVTRVRAPQSRVALTERICAAAGIQAAVVADATVVAGMVLESGNVDYDLTLRQRIADERQTLEATIAQTLLA